MLKSANTLYFTCKVTVYADNGPMVCPHETEESAQKEMDYYKGSKKVKAVMEDWTDEDQAWWNERKLQMVANFGARYVDNKAALGMCQLFRPSK